MVKHAIRTLKWDAIYQQSIFSQQAMKFISKMFLIASLMTGLTAFNFMEQFPILEALKIFFGAILWIVQPAAQLKNAFLAIMFVRVSTSTLTTLMQAQSMQQNRLHIVNQMTDLIAMWIMD